MTGTGTYLPSLQLCPLTDPLTPPPILAPLTDRLWSPGGSQRRHGDGVYAGVGGRRVAQLPLRRAAAQEGGGGRAREARARGGRTGQSRASEPLKLSSALPPNTLLRLRLRAIYLQV